jgi:hypothetical protein
MSQAVPWILVPGVAGQECPVPSCAGDPGPGLHARDIALVLGYDGKGAM